MKHFVKSAIPLIAVFFLFSCSENGNKEKKAETGNHEHNTTEQPQAAATANPVLKNDKLNAVYQHYVHLTTALTNSDVAEAKIAANAIEAGAKNLEGTEKIVSFASKISNAPDIEVQRTEYAEMTSNLAALIKKDGLSSGELYLEFCPMAFNDKGATWISNSKEIRNPYFGGKMLTCGQVQETIK